RFPSKTLKMAQVTPKSSSTTPVWGERTVSALVAMPCLMAAWNFLLAIPILGYIFALIEVGFFALIEVGFFTLIEVGFFTLIEVGFFALIEMFILRIWNWVHSLTLPGWLQSILIFLDHVIEKLVVIISDIIRWIVGPRDRKSLEKSQNSKQ
ncbi:hypothetical protein FHG87_015579, partial [Trinorchestia longiramus]